MNLNFPVTFNRQRFDQWLDWNKRKWRGRGPELEDALSAMYWLNRSAKQYKGEGDYHREIYALKAAFLRSLYEKGLVDQVTQQTQIRDCKRCNGSGKDPYGSDGGGDDYCERCGGTGEYSRHILYVFRIKTPLGGTVYTWHQPESAAGYLSSKYISWDSQPEYIDDSGGNLQLNSPLLLQSTFVAVMNYLADMGVDVREHNLFKLSDAFTVHTPEWIQRFQHWRSTRRSAPVDSTFDELPF